MGGECDDDLAQCPSCGCAGLRDQVGQPQAGSGDVAVLDRRNDHLSDLTAAQVGHQHAGGQGTEADAHDVSGRLGHIEVRRRTAPPGDGVDSPVDDEPVSAQFLHGPRHRRLAQPRELDELVPGQRRMGENHVKDTCLVVVARCGVDAAHLMTLARPHAPRPSGLCRVAELPSRGCRGCRGSDDAAAGGRSRRVRPGPMCRAPTSVVSVAPLKACHRGCSASGPRPPPWRRSWPAPRWPSRLRRAPAGSRDAPALAPRANG